MNCKNMSRIKTFIISNRYVPTYRISIIKTSNILVNFQKKSLLSLDQNQFKMKKAKCVQQVRTM